MHEYDWNKYLEIKIPLNFFQKELLKNGAIVQLISKHSGQLLQVVLSSNGVLVFDGSGANNAFNSKNISITKNKFQENSVLVFSLFYCWRKWKRSSSIS